MTLRDDLIAAKALIDTPERWYRKNYASFDGQQVCPLGAVSKATTGSPWLHQWYNEGRDDKCRVALVAALPRRWRVRGVAEFSDARGRKHADILALFDRAIEAAP